MQYRPYVHEGNNHVTSVAISLGYVGQSVARLSQRARGPVLDSRSGHTLSVPLSLIQEGQLAEVWANSTD